MKIQNLNISHFIWKLFVSALKLSQCELNCDIIFIYIFDIQSKDSQKTREWDFQVLPSHDSEILM